MNRRGRARPPRPSRPPTTHVATQPGAVWCRDVTFPPAIVRGKWFCLYLILDLYSRKVVGFEVHDTDSAAHAAHLARRPALAEGIHAGTVKPVPHGDDGASLKGTTVLAMPHWLGIEPSYSRPRVSDDNPYAEALFRTAKYRPEFPARGFGISTTPRPGPLVSSIGTTKNTDMARSARSAPRNATMGATTRSSPRVARSINRRGVAHHDGGAARPATGRRRARSRSIRSARR